MVLLMSTAVFAQKNKQTKAVKKATKQLTELYALDENQQEKMKKIQATRVENLAAIQHLSTQNVSLYRQKLESIRMGAEMSIKMMLTDPQLKIFQDQQIALRKKRVAKIEQWKKEGKDINEINEMVLEIN